MPIVRTILIAVLIGGTAAFFASRIAGTLHRRADTARVEQVESLSDDDWIKWFGPGDLGSDPGFESLPWTWEMLTFVVTFAVSSFFLTMWPRGKAARHGRRDCST